MQVAAERLPALGLERGLAASAAARASAASSAPSEHRGVDERRRRRARAARRRSSAGRRRATRRSRASRAAPRRAPNSEDPADERDDAERAEPAAGLDLAADRRLEALEARRHLGALVLDLVAEPREPDAPVRRGCRRRRASRTLPGRQLDRGPPATARGRRPRSLRSPPQMSARWSPARPCSGRGGSGRRASR